MALNIRGASRCALCGESFEEHDSPVCFLPFSTTLPLLQVLSDACVHFDCVRRHPAREKIVEQWLTFAGEEGTYPNGSVVRRFGRWGACTMNPLFVRLSYGPLLLELDLPSSTADELLASGFFEQAESGREARFASHGASLSLNRSSSRKPAWTLALRLCGHALNPEDAEPSQVCTHTRQLTTEDVHKFAVQTRSMLASIPRQS